MELTTGWSAPVLSPASSLAPVPVADLTSELQAIYEGALGAWRLTDLYSTHAKQSAQHALDGARALLPKTTGVIHEDVTAGIDALTRGLASWGVSAREPFRVAKGAFLHAFEYSQGYHRG